MPEILQRNEGSRRAAGELGKAIVGHRSHSGGADAMGEGGAGNRKTNSCSSTAVEQGLANCLGRIDLAQPPCVGGNGGALAGDIGGEWTIGRSQDEQGWRFI